MEGMKHYKAEPMIGKDARSRNRFMAKLSKAQLADAVAAHDRIQALSDDIRKRAGLEPVPESRALVEARERLSGSKVARELSPADMLAELVKRRRMLETARKAFDKDLAALAAGGQVGVSMIARSLDLSRQRVYQIRDAA